jgi:tetratricopeptide (TPR) repeat protein
MSTYPPVTAPARAYAPVSLLLAVALAFPWGAGAQPPLPPASSAVSSAGTSPTVPQLLALADRESAARRTAAALTLYERALQADPRSFAALCGAAREAVDLGEFERKAELRDDYYARATQYARRAVAAMPDEAEAHFHLARALGRTAMSLGARQKVKYAIEIRDAAQRALSLDTKHPGALHVLGVWHAEVMRLNGFERAFAKTFLGGQVFGTASWRDATRFLEQAVAVEPARLVHRLDLARIYRDSGRAREARESYDAALRAPLTDANDSRYREIAVDELRKLGRE